MTRLVEPTEIKVPPTLKLPNDRKSPNRPLPPTFKAYKVFDAPIPTLPAKYDCPPAEKSAYELVEAVADWSSI